MNSRQLDFMFKRYAEDRFIQFEIDNIGVVARNICTGCLHPFVTGQEKITIHKRDRKKVIEWLRKHSHHSVLEIVT